MKSFKEIIKYEEQRGDRWENGADHHPKSLEIMKVISEIDLKLYNDYFCWKQGGDGDNGETLMYQLDVYFEAKDRGDL